MQDKQLQLEDTVSADRKERIIFDPDAWKSKDKSGRKTSAITSRQNFDNEKFTRKADQVDEGTIQPSGDSKVDSAGPTQSETISDDKPKKSNNPQIEFVTGKEAPVGSASTTQGNQQSTGRKIAEALVKKALTQVKTDKNVGTEEIPFDGPYTKSPDTVVDKSGAKHTPYSRVRSLARQAMSKQVNKEEVEQIDELSKTTLGSYVKKATVSNRNASSSFAHNFRDGDEAAASKAAKTMDKREKGISGAVNRLSSEEVELSETCKDEKKNKPVKKEETDMSDKLTYAQFVEQLNEYNAGKDGVYRHKGTYGGSYDSNDDEDEDTPKKPAAPAVKRGRGRPAGSKSGANLKVTKGKSYGGIATHSLNLPNSNR